MAAIILHKAQRELLKKFGIYLVILIISTIFTVYLGGVSDDYQKKHTWLENDINELKRKLDGMNKKTLEFSEAVGTWEALPEEDKNLQGLRINDAKETLDKLQVKYKLSAFKTSFSKPEELVGDYQTDTVSMVSSIITISFNAISDEHVYNFVSEISKNFPGFVQIKSLSLNKPVAITKELLKKISAGEDVNILAVSLDFYWHDLKYKGTTTPATGVEVSQ